MTTTWYENPYFDRPEPESIDGGHTNRGPLWHAVSPRWGHGMHAMCSYHGMFPARLVHYFLQRYSLPGQLVVDPFSGRGTTGLQSRAEGRLAAVNDLSPLAYVLSKAKADPPPWARLTAYVDALEREYQSSRPGRASISDDIQMLFHPRTLKQLTFLRAAVTEDFSGPNASAAYMVAGCIAGMLHGAPRRDGSSAYLSVSMPNTFSMSPGYVRKYIADNGLEPPNQDVFERLRDKMARQYLDSNDGPICEVTNRDAVLFLSDSSLAGRADLVITSPPYLRVVNYGTSNWIRLWWLGTDDVSRQHGAGRQQLDAELDHGHRYDGYRDFMLRVLRATAQALRADGIATFVIGDVARPTKSALPLAERLWADIGRDSGLVLVDLIEDHLPLQNKVSRIWGETKGMATDRDCVLVLARADGTPRNAIEEQSWAEPYKDAGPDAAHALVRSARR